MTRSRPFPQSARTELEAQGLFYDSWQLEQHRHYSPAWFVGSAQVLANVRYTVRPIVVATFTLSML